uniref:K Homology domain-containing protein n=2 Tax=Panagrolaimus sp. ES5 TaxID=591445 RepID=A0AC34FBH2_9BILA
MSSGAVANNHVVVQEAVARAQQLAATNTSSSSDRLTAGQKRPSSPDNSLVPAKRANDGQNSAAMNMNEQILVETIEIPDNVVGLVIGRGGDQITTIQQQSGCRVQMAGEPTPQQTRLCTLNGARINIDRARNMISEVITRTNMKNNGQMTPNSQQAAAPTTPTPGGGIPPGCIQRILSIPGTKCGLIIGRNGDTIKSLQETLGVKMLLIQENQTISHGPKPLRITGTPDKVENACRTIESIINSEDGRPQYAKSVGEVIVPRSSVGIIIGKSGETIKRLINESGCKIQFKPDEDPNTPDRCATLQGTPDQIARATQMISDLLQRSQNSGVTETFLMHVPANKTGLVIGKGGDTIKQICGESGAHVELSRDPPPNASEKIFVIKGTPYQIHHAQHIIRIKVGDIPPGTPVPHFTGSTAAAASAIPAATNPYGSGFDGGYNQWQQNGTYTTPQTDANQWSNYYQQQQQQQQQQPQGVSAYTNAVYAAAGAGATTAAPASTQQQSAGAPVQDYSAQWAEYYRQMGMHEKAALVEEQAKKQQTSSSTSQQAGYGTGSYN